MNNQTFLRILYRNERSTFQSGYFIPRFQTVKWALCLPAACTAEDAQSIVEQALNGYNSTVGIQFIVDVDPKMCYVKQKSRSYSKETICVLYVSVSTTFNIQIEII